MTILTWDGSGDKIYETGVDRGVLYLSDRSGVPWNGLTSVEDRSVNTTTPNYFNGVKHSDSVIVGDYAGALRAFTYPEEFMQFEGIREINGGLFATGQTPLTFGLSYRTQIGNDQDPELGYKIHLLDHLTAVPSTKAFKTNAKRIDIVEFEWILTSVPSRILGYKPTSHLVFDTTKAPEGFVEELEGILYGTAETDAYLPAFENLAGLVNALTP